MPGIGNDLIDDFNVMIIHESSFCCRQLRVVFQVLSYRAVNTLVEIRSRKIGKEPTSLESKMMYWGGFREFRI